LSADDLPRRSCCAGRSRSVLSPDEGDENDRCHPELRHRTFLMTLYSTGMRRSELCPSPARTSIRNAWSSYPSGQGRHKTAKSAQPETARAASDLLPLGEVRNGWMFPSLQTRVPKPSAESRLAPAARQPGAPALPRPSSAHPRHSSRHTVRQRAELPVHPTLLGHADPRDTMICLHWPPQTRSANPLEI